MREATVPLADVLHPVLYAKRVRRFACLAMNDELAGLVAADGGRQQVQTVMASSGNGDALAPAGQHVLRARRAAAQMERDAFRGQILRPQFGGVRLAVVLKRAARG